MKSTQFTQLKKSHNKKFLSYFYSFSKFHLLLSLSLAFCIVLFNVTVLCLWTYFFFLIKPMGKQFLKGGVGTFTARVCRKFSLC